VDVERHLAAAFDHAPAALLLATPGGKIVRANRAACRLLGRGEDALRAADGLDFDGEVAVASFDDGAGERLSVLVLSEAADDAGESDPYHDRLTGLPSRLLFDEHLGLALARADREHTAVAVLEVDLQGFADVNQVFGRDAGDEVLRRAAQRIEASARLSDVASRQDGDEFLVLVGDLERRICLPAAEGIALRIEDALSAPFDIDGESVTCGAAVGFAIYPKQVRSAGELVTAAGLAADRRKRERRDAAA
jgi:diguanylate cyclase (GGDEF)-like protein